MRTKCRLHKHWSKMNAYIIKIFPLFLARIVFWGLSPIQNSARLTGWKKTWDFQQKSSPFILQMVRKRLNGSWLWWITNGKSQAANRSMSGPTTLSDLERRDITSQCFYLPDLNYAHMVWPRMSKFGKILQAVEKCISKGSATLPFQRAWSQHPPNFWDPTCAEMVWPTATNFGTATHMGVSFQGSSRQWQWMLITSWCCRLYDHSQFSFYTGLSVAPAVVS